MSEIEVISNSVYFPETRIADVTINADTKKYISTHRMMWSGKTETILFRSIGRNLNQIAMLGNMGRLKSVRLDELIAQHERATAALCEIAKAVR